MEYVLGVIAAALLGTSFVLQQGAAQDVPATDFLRLRLVADLLRKPRWLAGIGTMILGQLLSAWVVGHLILAIAEPLLATNLLLALGLAGPLSRQPLKISEVVGAGVLLAGVAALSAAQSASSAHDTIGSPRYWPYCGAAVAILIIGLALAARRQPGRARAISAGCGAGLAFGVQDALTRRVVDALGGLHQIAALLASWPIYCLLTAAVAGLWLMENAFSSAELHVSLPAITATEPVCGMVLGMIVFREKVPVSAPMIALQSAGLVALIAGVVLVARAPALAAIHHTRRVPAASGDDRLLGSSRRHPSPGRRGPGRAGCNRLTTAARQRGTHEACRDACAAPAGRGAAALGPGLWPLPQHRGRGGPGPGQAPAGIAGVSGYRRGGRVHAVPPPGSALDPPSGELAAEQRDHLAERTVRGVRPSRPVASWSPESRHGVAQVAESGRVAGDREPAARVSGIVEIFTDGACSPNPGPGGWGAILRYGRHEREMHGGEPATTNNRMEIMAAIRGLESLTRPSEVHVHTDSQYLRRGITEWLPQWKRNGWMTRDKKPVKNADLWQRLDSATQRHQVRWFWVKGHAGHPGNERADELACRGAGEAATMRGTRDHPVPTAFA